MAGKGDVYARFCLAIEKLDSEREEALAELKSLYKNSKHITSGFYLANYSSDPNKRAELLREVSNSGNSYSAVCARRELLLSEMLESPGSEDKPKFDRAYEQLLSLAKDGFMPASVRLESFIRVNFEKLSRFGDFTGDILELYGILEKPGLNSNYYKLRHAEILVKLGRWEEAVGIVSPIAEEFLKTENFTMEQSMSSYLGGDLYAGAKSATIMACAYENGLGLKKNGDKAKEYRGKVLLLQNESFCENFADSFEKSNVLLYCSPKDSKAYREASNGLKNSRVSRLREYNLKLAKKIEEASKKPIESLKNSSDEIEKVEYAKKLLDIKAIYSFRYKIGKYDNKNAQDAISILEKLAKGEVNTPI